MRFAPQHYYHVVHCSTKSTFVSLSISSAPFTVSQPPPSLPLASLPPSLFPFHTLALASLPLAPFLSRRSSLSLFLSLLSLHLSLHPSLSLPSLHSHPLTPFLSLLPPPFHPNSLSLFIPLSLSSSHSMQ